MPIARVVAALALLTTAAVMCVIFAMTAKASGLGVQEGSVRMTIKACRLLMLAQQRVARCIVIKLCVNPFSWLVTRGTIIPHGLFMRTIILMTRHAFGGGIATLCCRLMTAGAVRFKVRARQLEIGIRMVERCFVQNNDNGVPTFMLRVACAALLSLCVRMHAVKTGCNLNIFSYGLMTIHAELSLRTLVEHLVTRTALSLDFGVTFNNRTRHDECFYILCSSILY
jgi:hypothetical protein